MGAIQTVAQMHFVPLADVLCDAIVSMNRTGQATTLAAVRQHIIRNCPYVAPPSAEMLKQTVANLTATGLVYKMGDHLFVSVPAQIPSQTKVSMRTKKIATMTVINREQIIVQKVTDEIPIS